MTNIVNIVHLINKDFILKKLQGTQKHYQIFTIFQEQITNDVKLK